MIQQRSVLGRRSREEAESDAGSDAMSMADPELEDDEEAERASQASTVMQVQQPRRRPPRQQVISADDDGNISTVAAAGPHQHQPQQQPRRQRRRPQQQQSRQQQPQAASPMSEGSPGEDPLLTAVRNLAAGEDGGEAAEDTFPEDEWEPVPLRIGIYKYYADIEDDEDLYCAACASNRNGRMPPIDEAHVKAMSDALAKGFKTGQIRRAGEEVYAIWNNVIRREVDEMIATEKAAVMRKQMAFRGSGDGEDASQQQRALEQQYASRYDPMPEWTFKSIMQHILFHNNDPVMVGIRNAMKQEALADAIALYGGAVKKHSTKTNADGTPVFKLDLGAFRTASMLSMSATRINRETYKSYAPKSGGKDSSGNQLFAQPGQGAIDNMYQNTFSNKKRKI
jgi:hypothetical protein